MHFFKSNFCKDKILVSIHCCYKTVQYWTLLKTNQLQTSNERFRRSKYCLALSKATSLVIVMPARFCCIAKMLRPLKYKIIESKISIAIKNFKNWEEKWEKNNYIFFTPFSLIFLILLTEFIKIVDRSSPRPSKTYLKINIVQERLYDS